MQNIIIALSQGVMEEYGRCTENCPGFPKNGELIQDSVLNSKLTS